MKKIIISLIAAISVSFASPAVMGGISYKFGKSDNDLSGAGVTAKILSSDKEKKPVVGAGVTYYPWAKDSKKFGIDVSAGYTFKKGAVMGGWDFLQNQPSVSLGYNKGINTDDKSQFVDGIQDARCSASKKK
jgi:hypothetical protein